MEGSVDVGFSRDMREHHAQAVQMSVLVRDRSADPEVRTLALDVLLTQQQQAGQMYGWLADWGVAQSGAAAPMQWMSQASMAGHTMAGAGATPAPTETTNNMGRMQMAPTMPGMASQADLQRLAGLSGVEAERFYLQLMIPHHQGAVAMAEVAAEQAETVVVRRLAENIVASQSAEITVLQQMLTARGGPLADA
jgi:uncharacterized protein (DUF305 family)